MPELEVSLEFDSKGNPFPYDFIKMTNNDLRTNLVDNFDKSLTRNSIYSGYNKYCSDLTNLVNENITQWIGGSFTTTKNDPHDIDLVNNISVKKINQLKEKLFLFDTNLGQEKDKKDYLVDGYIIPSFDIKQPDLLKYFKRNYEYWTGLFGHDRNGNPKGIILIELKSGKINEKFE